MLLWIPLYMLLQGWDLCYACCCRTGTVSCGVIQSYSAVGTHLHVYAWMGLLAMPCSVVEKHVQYSTCCRKTGPYSVSSPSIWCCCVVGTAGCKAVEPFGALCYKTFLNVVVGWGCRLWGCWTLWRYLALNWTMLLRGLDCKMWSCCSLGCCLAVKLCRLYCCWALFFCPAVEL